MTEDIIYNDGDPMPEEQPSPDKQDKYKTLIEQTRATRFKPNETGNPGGRPAGKSITAELRKLIDKGTNAEDMAQVLYDIAQKGSRAQVEALKELLNRTDGKVPDTHKLESDVPISIVFKEVERKEDG